MISHTIKYNLVKLVSAQNTTFVVYLVKPVEKGRICTAIGNLDESFTLTELDVHLDNEEYAEVSIPAAKFEAIKSIGITEVIISGQKVLLQFEKFT